MIGMEASVNTKVRCQGCGSSEPLPFDFTMAFHPIGDLGRGVVWGYEALVRERRGNPQGRS
jgi:EAL domain-containing protein (putative c-di-GMP-specific phosphodiesterase class I)